VPASHGLRVVLQVSRFPWGEDPGAWLRATALAADERFRRIALMDHLIQIPQVDTPGSRSPSPGSRSGWSPASTPT